MLGKAIQPEIESMIEAGQYDELRQIMNEIETADVAEILDELEDEARALLFRLLPTERASEVFALLEFDGQEDLISSLSNEQVAQILNQMSPDDRTSLLEELPGEISNRLLRTLNPDELLITRSLLGYPEESIGRLMTPEYVAVRPDWTVEHAMGYIRQQAHRVETINVIYVLDEHGRLIDDLRIGELLLADPQSLIAELSDQQFVSLSAPDDQEEAVEAFKKYDRVALPVTDSKGVMVGIVTVDDVLDVAEEEDTEDVQKFGGQAALEDPYMATRVFELARKRGGWLALLLVSSFLTVNAMEAYSNLTLILPLLSVFIPMIISSGGNSGSQSAAMIIRGLAVHEIELHQWYRVFLRELVVGITLGLFLGLLAGIYCFTIQQKETELAQPKASAAMLHATNQDGDLAAKEPAPIKPWHYPLVVLLSITGVVMIGTLVGSMLPFFFKSIHLDPAVCSGPFIATFVDVSGIILFFTLVKYLFASVLN